MNSRVVFCTCTCLVWVSIERFVCIARQACSGSRCSDTYGLPNPFFTNPTSCVFQKYYSLKISSGDTKTFISSCTVTNSSSANAALSQLSGFKLTSNQGSCPCAAVPDPTKGYVVGLKLNARVSLSSAAAFAPDFTYKMRGCDATYTYRSTALANGEMFTMWVDLISNAAAHRVSWSVVIACLVSLLAVFF